MRLVGADLPIHAPREQYRDLVQRLKRDDHARGALVTTHKIDLFEACRDLFDRIDESADLCGEASCLSKPGGLLVAKATDPISAGKALGEFLPPDHFQRTGGDVLCLGAGGSAIAITLNLLQRYRPARITVVNRSQGRLDAMRSVHAKVKTASKVDYIRNDDPQANDRIVRELPPGSLVVNATGMGKDTPGSPITDAARFPERGVAWELNYRGELQFLAQALAQPASLRLDVQDGWRYFIHGWATIIEEVFDLTIDAPRLGRLANLSEAERPPYGLS